MNKALISTFKQAPKTNVGKWALGLCLIAIFSGPILGISAAIIVPLITETSWGDSAGIIFGFSMMACMAAVIVSSLILSIIAFSKGERSWGVWISLLFSGASILFWILFIVGEFIFPH